MGKLDDDQIADVIFGKIEANSYFIHINGEKSMRIIEAEKVDLIDHVFWNYNN